MRDEGSIGVPVGPTGGAGSGWGNGDDGGAVMFRDLLVLCSHVRCAGRALVSRALWLLSVLHTWSHVRHAGGCQHRGAAGGVMHGSFELEKGTGWAGLAGLRPLGLWAVCCVSLTAP